MARKKGSLNKKKVYKPYKAEIETDNRGIQHFPVTESSKTAVYSCELKVNDKVYQVEGNTLEEALNDIKIEPTRGVLKIYTKGILKVKKGDKEVERLLFIRQMSRLFGQASKLGRECAMVKATRLIDALLSDIRH